MKRRKHTKPWPLIISHKPLQPTKVSGEIEIKADKLAHRCCEMMKISMLDLLDIIFATGAVKPLRLYKPISGEDKKDPRYIINS